MQINKVEGSDVQVLQNRLPENPQITISNCSSYQALKETVCPTQLMSKPKKLITEPLDLFLIHCYNALDQPWHF